MVDSSHFELHAPESLALGRQHVDDMGIRAIDRGSFWSGLLCIDLGQ